MLARLRKSIKEKDAGFTLVELLVVMIIIGILAAIAIPVFLNQRKKAVDTAIKSDLRSVAQSVETSFVDTQTYPTAAAYTAAGTGGTTSPGSVVIDARVSSNNLIEYKAVTGGYCLRGSSANGTATSGSFYWYSSNGGGLQTGSATPTAPTGC